MKITKFALGAMISAGFLGSQADAQQQFRSIAYGHQDQATQVGFFDRNDSCDDSSCGGSCDSSCGGIFGDNGCDSGSCDSGCGLLDGGLLSGLGGGGNGLDEPWTLFGNNNARGINFGGWSNVGYHTANNNFGFNNRANEVQLHQQWLWGEKVADGSDGLGWGFRMDYLYGTDAQDTQAFGIPNNHWDNAFDNGGANGYGHAIPQLYGELAMGDLSVKVGKFFTIIGNEVVGATGNFFYSRQLTFFNAEPFTHTGVLGTYQMNENTSVFGGWALGWDSGFEDNGDVLLSGFSTSVSDDISFTYASSLGRISNNPFSGFLGVDVVGAGTERGYNHSGILSVALTDKLTYVSQTDWLYTTDESNQNLRNTFGSIHYLLYNVNDTWGFGTRSEWFNVGSSAAGIRNADIYNQTVGINWRPTANLVMRPEVRWIWDREGLGANDGNATADTAFGMDGVFTF